MRGSTKLDILGLVFVGMGYISAKIGQRIGGFCVDCGTKITSKYCGMCGKKN